MARRAVASVAGVLIEGLPLWVASTNVWIVAPPGPGGECVLIDAPPDPEAILRPPAATTG